MVLMDPVPGEEHRKTSADYVKCLSKVSSSSLMFVCPFTIDRMLIQYRNRLFLLK